MAPTPTETQKQQPLNGSQSQSNTSLMSAFVSFGAISISSEIGSQTLVDIVDVNALWKTHAWAEEVKMRGKVDTLLVEEGLNGSIL